MKAKVLGITKTIETKKNEAESVKYAMMAGELSKEVYDVICKYEYLGLSAALGALEFVKWALINETLNEAQDD